LDTKRKHRMRRSKRDTKDKIFKKCLSTFFFRKKRILTALLLLTMFTSKAQTEDAVFHFLELPLSSHVAGLGGTNISIIEDDITMALHNPALLSCISTNSLSLNYMTYMDGVGVGNAAYGRFLTDRSTIAISAQYINYGTLQQTDIEDTNLGTFSAKDIAIAGTYAYDLSDYWSGGVTAKFIFGNYASYSSFAIGFDLGLNYYNSQTDFSASFVLKNIGGQIDAFDEVKENLPLDLQFGISKKLAHAPFRISVTMQGLNDWSSSFTQDGEKEKFSKLFMNHFVFGVDFLASENFYISGGYNCKRASEMKVNDVSNWAGMSIGAGMQINRLKIGVSYAKYHVSSASLFFNLSTTL